MPARAVALHEHSIARYNCEADRTQYRPIVTEHGKGLLPRTLWREDVSEANISPFVKANAPCPSPHLQLGMLARRLGPVQQENPACDSPVVQQAMQVEPEASVCPREKEKVQCWAQVVVRVA
jgi:hypothetical protein